MNGFIFAQDDARIDRPRVHRWLSTQAYWADGRSRATQDAAIDGSRNYGVWSEETDAQVACARVVTDLVTFAWLCDVFVDPSVRGRGVGKQLVSGVLDDLGPLGLRRMLLATADAHGLYAQFGFEALEEPSRYMLRPMS
ncbi:GNAT family N-acetyltransferase [Microbacterium sp. NPDC055903]